MNSQENRITSIGNEIKGKNGNMITEKILSNTEATIEKKENVGFFSRFFSTLSVIKFRKAKIDEQDEEISKTKFYSEAPKNDKIEKVVNFSKNERFIEVTNKVLITIREKKQKSRRAKFESIVDMMMSRKVFHLSQITKSNSDLKKPKLNVLKRSVSCPNNLDLLRKQDNQRLYLKNSRLSCSFGENITKIQDEKIKNRKYLSRQLSFDSSSSSSSRNSSVSFESEEPRAFKRYIKNKNGLSENCNKAIVNKIILYK
jgi:hypothetical protein